MVCGCFVYVHGVAELFVVSFPTTALLFVARNLFAYFCIARELRKKINPNFLEKKLICFLSSSALIQIFFNFCNFFFKFFFVVADFGKEKFLLSKGGFVCVFCTISANILVVVVVVVLLLFFRGGAATRRVFWKVCCLFSSASTLLLEVSFSVFVS